MEAFLTVTWWLGWQGICGQALCTLALPSSLVGWACVGIQKGSCRSAFQSQPFPIDCWYALLAAAATLKGLASSSLFSLKASSSSPSTGKDPTPSHTTRDFLNDGEDFLVGGGRTQDGEEEEEEEESEFFFLLETAITDDDDVEKKLSLDFLLRREAKAALLSLAVEEPEEHGEPEEEQLDIFSLTSSHTFLIFRFRGHSTTAGWEGGGWGAKGEVLFCLLLFSSSLGVGGGGGGER